ncbi:MAG: hypothetical protein JKY20_04480 [Alphaproteobacteria bacterium]|nr:hypothetical protein [Alphaproteobacteria bacterium]
MSTAEILGAWIWEVAFGLCFGLVMLLMASRFFQTKMRERRIRRLQDMADIDDLDSALVNFNKERIKFFIVLALAIIFVGAPLILK